MDFKTCSSLRSVSAKFNLHATKYFRSLRQFDLSVVEKNFDGCSESMETQYTCLLETVTKRCDNLEQITGMQMYSGMNLVSRNVCLQNLPKLTSIVITDGHLQRAELFGFLKQLPNVCSVKVGEFQNGQDVPEEEKLVVSELGLNRGDFWRIFRVDQLRKLVVSRNMLRSDADVTMFCSIVERCQRLEELQVEVNAEHSSFFPPLLRLPSVLPQLKQFNLNMWYVSARHVMQIVRQYPSIGRYTKRLKMQNSEPTRDLIEFCFL